MATKGTYAKIKELRGVKPEKISEKHLKELQDAVKDINIMHHEIGVLEAKKHNMIHALAQKQSGLMEMQDTFEKEYGSTDININDGSIKHKDVEVNKED